MVAVKKNTTLNVGDTLTLTCSVAANDLPSLSMELMWLVRSSDSSGSPRVLIHIGRDGLLKSGSEAVGLSRVNASTFRLLLHKVEGSDSGLYSCLVKAWLQQGKDKWYQAAEKTSDSVQVLVTQLGKSESCLTYFVTLIFLLAVKPRRFFPVILPFLLQPFCLWQLVEPYMGKL